MKRQAVVLSFFLSVLLLLSCGSGSNRFKMTGRLLHFNQGIFLIYSSNGAQGAIDTIKVDGGRFVWDIQCDEPVTYIMVLPNFSEQPIFAEPGKKVKLDADASRLRAMEIKGSKENELMTAFRKQIIDASPLEEKLLAEDFIKAHPKSAVATYLLQHYFVNTSESDYDKAISLIETIETVKPESGDLVGLKNKIKARIKSLSATSLPQFSVSDINDKHVSDGSFRNGVAVVYTWSSWNYESQNMLRKLNMLLLRNVGKLHLLGINLDANRAECRTVVEREAITFPQVCDGLLFDSPLMSKFGLSDVCDNMIFVDGKVVSRSVSTMQLEQRLTELLK